MPGFFIPGRCEVGFSPVRPGARPHCARACHHCELLLTFQTCLQHSLALPVGSLSVLAAVSPGFRASLSLRGPQAWGTWGGVELAACCQLNSSGWVLRSTWQTDRQVDPFEHIPDCQRPPNHRHSCLHVASCGSHRLFIHSCVSLWLSDWWSRPFPRKIPAGLKATYRDH